MTRLFSGTAWDQPPKCERCDKLQSECQCPKHLKGLLPPEKQTAKVAVEKRKKQKLVTVVRGLSPTESDLAALLTKLQTSCGAGGSVQTDEIEIQGDHADRVRELLRTIGYRVG
ncbi:translation initiation factor [Anatilimnocola sp. NA78]|uniref:translation initiation factor n=1 Tax=Anatilimnocola sp. NA78 TaxID=3415683 RepID=UPI003CE54542